MTLFCDTSALAKRYITELGSQWVEKMLEPTAGHDIVISRITPVELQSAIARRKRGGSLSVESETAARQRLHLHCAHEYMIVHLHEAHFRTAELLSFRYALRAYDAMQLAVALAILRRFQPPDYRFVSADDELNHAASAEGLLVENPNGHP